VTDSLQQHLIVTVIGDLIADEFARMRPAESEYWKRRQWHEDDTLVARHKATKYSNEDEVAVDVAGKAGVSRSGSSVLSYGGQRSGRLPSAP